VSLTNSYGMCCLIKIFFNPQIKETRQPFSCFSASRKFPRLYSLSRECLTAIFSCLARHVWLRGFINRRSLWKESDWFVWGQKDRFSIFFFICPSNPYKIQKRLANERRILTDCLLRPVDLTYVCSVNHLMRIYTSFKFHNLETKVNPTKRNILPLNESMSGLIRSLVKSCEILDFVLKITGLYNSSFRSCYNCNMN